MGLVWPQEPLGVVTALQGTAQLSRPALPTPVALRFKDGLLLRDVVDTSERSMLRLLFGGKSTVTVRELSRLEVHEETLPTGGTLSVHELNSGAILVNVARRLLRRGDEIQIRTPNAVAAVRGTIISVQCRPDLAQCTFTVLAGSATITPRRGVPVNLAANTAVTVTGTPADDGQIGPLQAITPAQANQLLQQYTIRPAVREAAIQAQTVQAQLQTATELATVMAGVVNPDVTPTPIASPTPSEVATPSIIAPVAPDVPQAVEEATASVPTPMGTIILAGTFSGTDPLLQVSWPLVLPAPENLFEVPTGGNASIAGPLLRALEATMDLGASTLVVGGGLSSATTRPLFGIEASTVTIGGSLVAVPSGGRFTAAGPLADLMNTTLTVAGGPLMAVEDGGSFEVTINGATPWLNLQTSVLSSTTSLSDLQNAQITLAGPVVQLRQRSQLTNVAGPVLRLTNSSLAAASLFSTDGSGNQVTLVGSVLDLTNATVTLRTLWSVPASGGDTILQMRAAGEPLLRLTDSALTLTGPGLALLQFGSETGSPSMLQGVGLVASGSTLDIQGAVMSLAGVTLLDTLPQLQLAATTVTQTGASSFINVNGPPSQVPGSLMNATNSTVSTTGSLLQIQETTLTMASSSANNAEGGISLVRLDQSLVKAGDFFAEISGALVLNGSLVQATDSILATAGDFIMLRRGGTLSSAGAQALVQLTDSSLRAFTLLVNDGGSVDLVGTSLLNAVNSQLTFDFAVVQSPFGGQITSATTAPLIALDGGTLSSEGHLFVLSGNVFSPSPNTVAPLQTGGTLLAGTNGAIINIAGQALRLDTALLQASLPILHLIGAPTQETVLTSGSSTVDLVKSTMTGLGPVVALDRSIINVTNGPLIRLANGSVMLVNGDLLQLLNGSRINVVNGPLILVAGNGSLLNVSGALVFFGGTGGNQIVVNNSIAPTATMSGIPVSATSGGAVSIGPAPVTNPHLGSITIGSGGSAIQATDGGVVTNAVPGGPTN